MLSLNICNLFNAIVRAGCFRIGGFRSRLFVLTVLALISAAAFGQSPASPYQHLHEFGGTATLSNGTKGADGNDVTSLFIDKQGDKFVCAHEGGLYGSGGVFELTAQGQYVDLHDFQNEGDCLGMVEDSGGNLYGVNGYGGTFFNGSFEGGTLWKLSKAGVYTILHTLLEPS